MDEKEKRGWYNGGTRRREEEGKGGALSIMHENGLIHRDISPDNLMLENGRIRLLDFGCAREASRGTETMTIALKHGYAPIEQYQQKGQGPWTDIYALSATIYFCLTGKVPPQALDRISEDELLLPGKLGVDITEAQEQALLKGMRIQPNRRFSTVKELWAGLYVRPSEGGTETGRRISPVPSGTEPQADGDGAQPPRAAEEREESASGDPAGNGSTKEETASDNPAGNESTESPKPNIPRRRRNIYLLSGVAAACAVLLIGIVAYRNAAGEKGNLGGGDTRLSGIEDAGGGQTPSGTGGMPPSDAAGGDGERGGVFEDAVTFSEGDEEEFARLLEDDSVPAIVMDCGFLGTQEAVLVTKPVLVAEGTEWWTLHLTVASKGYVQVEGVLNMAEPSYLRLEGDGLRLCIAEKGQFWTEDTSFVWMDQERALARENGGAVDLPHKLVFSPDAFDGDGVESVTDYEALTRAARLGQMISIDGDITLEGDIW